jgi:hypothetical protein
MSAVDRTHNRKAVEGKCIPVSLPFTAILTLAPGSLWSWWQHDTTDI